MNPSVDARFMAAAIALARRGQARTAPNPNVGCILVREGRVVGRGWTQPGGRPYAEAMALVRGIIAMGHAIDLLVIAEGVESAIQAECLAQAGCDLLQGYHIGLPMELPELMELLAAPAPAQASGSAHDRP